MLLPFKIPHAGLQALRKRMMYWRVVYVHRLRIQNDLHASPFLRRITRWLLAVLVLKVFQKGLRAGKEERMHDYNARKANVEAVEASMWDDELSLHKPDVAEAERAVFRQRTVEWEFRMKPNKLFQHSMGSVLAAAVAPPKLE